MSCTQTDAIWISPVHPVVGSTTCTSIVEDDVDGNVNVCSVHDTPGPLGAPDILPNNEPSI